MFYDLLWACTYWKLILTDNDIRLFPMSPLINFTCLIKMTDLSVLPDDEFAINSIDFYVTDKSLFLSFLRTIQAKRKPSNANEASHGWDSRCSRNRSMLKVQKLRDQLGTRITIRWSGRNTHRVRTWGGKKIKVFFKRNTPLKINSTSI